MSRDAKRSLTIIALSVVLLVPSILWSGFALSTLWGWFVVPLGVAPIGVLHASGVSLIVAFMTHQIDMKNDDRTAGEAATHFITLVVAKPAFALAFGFVIHALLNVQWTGN